MNKIKHSMRNKLLMISRAEPSLVFTSALFGFWLVWNSISPF